MATTFLKRQKEMKRLEKQREKAERRTQKRLASRAQNEPAAINMGSADHEAPQANIAPPSKSDAA